MNTQDKINKIKNCADCFGQGVVGWISADGDYDFEYCECNPDNLIFDHDGELVL